MRLISDFLSSTHALNLQNWLEQAHEVSWMRESFVIYGRSVLAPRSLAWFGEPGLNYRYTQLDHIGAGWPAPIAKLRQQVESASGQRFNFVLINRYAHGQEHMGWHCDDEKGCCGDIASLSIGATRRFSIDIDEADAPRRESVDLNNGSLLIFDGRQRHCLRPTKKPVAQRINLTFRLIET